MVTTEVEVGELGGGRIRALVCAAETMIRPKMPEKTPFLSDFVFDRTYSLSSSRKLKGGAS